jgi:hypothetical protein
MKLELVGTVSPENKKKFEEKLDQIDEIVYETCLSMDWKNLYLHNHFAYKGPEGQMIQIASLGTYANIQLYVKKMDWKLIDNLAHDVLKLDPHKFGFFVKDINDTINMKLLNKPSKEKMGILKLRLQKKYIKYKDHCFEKRYRDEEKVVEINWEPLPNDEIFRILDPKLYASSYANEYSSINLSVETRERRYNLNPYTLLKYPGWKLTSCIWAIQKKDLNMGIEIVKGKGYGPYPICSPCGLKVNVKENSEGYQVAIKADKEGVQFLGYVVETLKNSGVSLE